ncbi:MAG: RlmE family RNA methyltransferase, partial [Magnetococcales bacterium]|nr:RlmE family RNA methyltransferase [Magnetococcales bacterium]
MTAPGKGSGRRPSSGRWLEEHRNDPYVKAAHAAGYRSRAAYKLLELQEKYHLMRPGMRVLDLGAAPGGWTQVAVREVHPGGVVVAIDLLPVEPVQQGDREALILQGDFLAEGAGERLRERLPGGGA